MRSLSKILLLAAFSMTSCQRQTVPFQSGSLSPAEQQSISATFPGFAGSTNVSCSALWIRSGVIRHVCLYDGIGSIVMPYDVFVFDGDGHIIEANIMEAPSGAGPLALSSISPLSALFSGGVLKDGQLAKVGLAYSHEEGHQKVADHSRQMKKIQDVFETWKRSGSTNWAVGFQMIVNAITNSER